MGSGRCAISIPFADRGDGQSSEAYALMPPRSAAYASAPWRRATLAAHNFAAVAEDIADIKIELKGDIAALAGQLTSMEGELKAIRHDLDDLQEKFENVSGFRKEIDHALGRIAAIEKHLGINKRIAA